MSKFQVDSRSTINLLLGKLTAGMPDLMMSLGNKIANFNKEICSLGTSLRARGEDMGNFLPQIFATYADCSLDHGPFIHYIRILDNQ